MNITKQIFELWKEDLNSSLSIKEHTFQGRVNVLFDLIADIARGHEIVVQLCKDLARVTNNRNIEASFRLEDCAEDLMNRFERDLRPLAVEARHSLGNAFHLADLLETNYANRIASLNLYQSLLASLLNTNSRGLSSYD